MTLYLAPDSHVRTYIWIGNDMPNTSYILPSIAKHTRKEGHFVVDQQEVRWMVTFGHSQGGSRTEHDFPRYDFWHPNKEASIVEGKRVLKELALRGDKRDWYAAGYPDPFEVGSGKQSGESWIVLISDLS